MKSFVTEQRVERPNTIQGRGRDGDGECHTIAAIKMSISNLYSVSYVYNKTTFRMVYNIKLNAVKLVLIKNLIIWNGLYELFQAIICLLLYAHGHLYI